MAISFESFAQSRRASIVAIEMAGKKKSVGGDFIPEKVVIVGQYDSAKTGVTVGEIWQGFTADDFGNRYGFGSEIHRQAIQILAALGGFSSNVSACPVAPPTGSPTAGTTTLTYVGAATTAGTQYIAIAGDLYQISVSSGMTAVQQAAALVAAITADINAAITAAVGGTGSEHIVTLTSKTANANANEIRVVQNPGGVTQVNANPSGTSITIASEYLTGGSGNPVTTTVFTTSGGADNLGDTWYTFITCPYTDSTNLATYKAAAVARADPAVKRPFGYVAGYVKKTYAEAYALPAATNSKFCAPVWEVRSLDPAPELAAATIGAVAYESTIDPGRPFKTVALPTLCLQTRNLSYNEVDALFIAGMGYFKLGADGVLRLGDLALSYRTAPSGATTAEWFDLVSLTRRQEKIYSIDQLFNSEPYTRAIAGSDDMVTAKDYVIKPKKIIADLREKVDFWASQGWTKNPGTVKDSITAEINALFEGRMDAYLLDDEAQALRIIGIKYAFLY